MRCRWRSKRHCDTRLCAMVSGGGVRSNGVWCEEDDDNDNRWQQLGRASHTHPQQCLLHRCWQVKSRAAELRDHWCHPGREPQMRPGQRQTPHWYLATSVTNYHNKTRTIVYKPVSTRVWALPHATRVTKRAVSDLTRRGLGKDSGREDVPGGKPWPHWPSVLLGGAGEKRRRRRRRVG